MLPILRARCGPPLHQVTATMAAGGQKKGVGSYIGQVQAQVHVDDGEH